MIPTLLAAVWLTLPHCQAAQGCDTVVVVCRSINDCDTVGVCIPETELATLRVYWWERWQPQAVLWREKDVRGREGQRDSVQLPDGILATVYVTTTDLAGNESCPSNFVTVNGLVGVAPGHGGPVEIRYYDISGRRVPAPRAPGVYWREERTPTTRSRRRLIVL